MLTKTGVELSEAECWEVLTTARVGRVLYTRNAMPLAHPVPFVLYHRLIVFSLDPVTAARIARLGHDVGAFQVDDLTGTGAATRSVTVHGELGLLEPGQIAAVEGCGLPAHGGEAVHVYIVPEVIAGSRLDPFVVDSPRG
jgi:nitroimidazol reductase NimA-like FMN-containing flavoprotein (pyridoxamine 5'-phosphate oxidase superfamily)